MGPRVLVRSSLTLAEAILIQNIGLDKGSKMFRYILSAVTLSRMETLEARIENLKFWGLSAKEIWQVFRIAPIVLSFSKENIGEKMKFVVNHLEKIESTTGHGLSILKVLMMTEGRFIKIIEGHPDSETLWTIYENAISDAPNGTKRSSSLRL
ncbi:hypothetical protein SUGI_0470420 [Cryptomeria japonica]|nr:hypothetical protein SUGI_0470420 [Cryptomeria japonica]